MYIMLSNFPQLYWLVGTPWTFLFSVLVGHNKDLFYFVWGSGRSCKHWKNVTINELNKCIIPNIHPRFCCHWQNSQIFQELTVHKIQDSIQLYSMVTHMTYVNVYITKQMIAEQMYDLVVTIDSTVYDLNRTMVGVWKSNKQWWMFGRVTSNGECLEE